RSFAIPPRARRSGAGECRLWPGLSVASDHHHRSLRGWRQRRCRGAHHRASTERAARPKRRDRERRSAGGVVGTQRAARAAADGYTLLLSVESTMAVAKLVQPSTVQYDSQKDFLPISLIGTSPLVLAGKKALAAESTD